MARHIPSPGQRPPKKKSSAGPVQESRESRRYMEFPALPPHPGQCHKAIVTVIGICTLNESIFRKLN